VIAKSKNLQVPQQFDLELILHQTLLIGCSCGLEFDGCFAKG